MVKMTDIAAKAGVSQATVSLVLNNRTDGVRISEGTRQRVLAAARDLGYQRNEVARAMVTGRTRIIGFAAARQEVEESIRSLVGLVAGATASEYNVRVFPLESTRPDYDLGRACVEQRLAGLAAMDLGADLIARIKPELDRFEIPLVILGGPGRHSDELRVVADEAPGILEALKHLKGLGHQKVGWIEGGPRGACLSSCRDSVFREACGKAGLAVNDAFLLKAGPDATGIEPELGRLFGAQDRPTALLCCCDRVGMLALRAARKAGRRVPEDISLVGCGGASVCELGDPPLSSITVPYRRLGQHAAEAIVARAEQRKKDPAAWNRDIQLPTEFVARASVGPA